MLEGIKSQQNMYTKTGGEEIWYCKNGIQNTYNKSQDIQFRAEIQLLRGMKKLPRTKEFTSIKNPNSRAPELHLGNGTKGGGLGDGSRDNSLSFDVFPFPLRNSNTTSLVVFFLDKVLKSNHNNHSNILAVKKWSSFRIMFPTLSFLPK